MSPDVLALMANSEATVNLNKRILSPSVTSKQSSFKICVPPPLGQIGNVVCLPHLSVQILTVFSFQRKCHMRLSITIGI